MFCILMRTWSLPPLEGRMQTGTHLISAYLTLGNNTHSAGAFAHTRPLISLARRWAHYLHRQRKRTGPLTLHIVHNSQLDSGSLSASKGSIVPPGNIVLHQAPARILARALPTVDLRWLAYGTIFERLKLGADACVFAIDLTDVGVIGNLSALCERYPDAIVASSDTCAARTVKRWLRGYAGRANFTLSSRLGDFLLGKVNRSTPLHNCAITGGKFAAFEPFRQQMVSAIRRHHQPRRHVPSAPLVPIVGGLPPESHWVDMLVFNELLLQRANETGAPTLTGYPRGPVNLPMWSTFCERAPCGPKVPVTSACILNRLRSMSPQYFFTHKIKSFEP